MPMSFVYVEEYHNNHLHYHLLDLWRNMMKMKMKIGWNYYYFLLCRSCFMITKYSFLDFVIAKNTETWDIWTKNLDWGFRSLILVFWFCFNRCKTASLELLNSTVKESYHLILNFLIILEIHAECCS
jgi:hypothetical protein